jgi:hypothetical protein
MSNALSLLASIIFVTIFAMTVFICRGPDLSAMVAPYFGGLLIVQSGFGHPAGAVLPRQMLTTQTLRTFPQNLACGACRGISTPHVLVGVESLHWRLR